MEDVSHTQERLIIMYIYNQQLFQTFLCSLS